MPTMHYARQQNNIPLSKQDFTLSQYKRKLIEKQKHSYVFVSWKYTRRRYLTATGKKLQATRNY